MTDQLRANANLVDSLGSAARHGGSALADAPGLLRRVLEEGAWREFVTQRDEHVSHRRFSDFVKAQPLKGLGVDMALIERIVGTSDPDLLVMLRGAEKVGKPGPAALGEMRGDSPSNAGGNESDYLAQRLRSQHPKHYERVQSGELSINAASVLAGIRPRRVSVRIDDATSAARSLRRNMSDAAFAVLAEEVQRLASPPAQDAIRR